MKTKHFDCHFEIKSIKKEGDIGIVEGFASTFGNTDRVGDIIDPGAFTESLIEIERGKGHIPMLFQHRSDQVIGKFRAKDMRETDQGLFVRGEINLKTEKGRDTHALLEARDISDFSIGFRTREEHFDEVERVNHLEKLSLMEISIVTFPANEQAIVTDVKSVFHDLPILRDENSEPNTRHEWDKEKALENIEAFEGEKDHAFLWIDKEDRKFLIADVIDGELKAVPRAIFAAAGALCGDRGALGISDDEKVAVRRNIERYYEKQDIESPFKKGLGPNELGRMSPKQIKTYLRENGFSVSGAEYLSHMASKGIKSLSDSGGNTQSDSGQVASVEYLLDELKSKVGG